MSRRSVVKNLAVLGAAAGLGTGRATAQDADIAAARIPHWRGFNLQGRFATPGKPSPGRAFEEFDFAAVAEWGFALCTLRGQSGVLDSGRAWRTRTTRGTRSTARCSSGPRRARRTC